MTTPTSTEKPSVQGTLRHPAFRNCQASVVVSNLGTWLGDTAVAWLMKWLEGLDAVERADAVERMNPTLKKFARPTA